jgi:pyruvate dehydrogenase E2 component (dihydrolipoamide acetyltransferase)
MPRQGNNIESSVITQWRKVVGEWVKKGEVLLEIETDKAVMEIESPADGILLETFAKAGDDVPVMSNIGVIGAQGEDVTGFRPAGAQPSAAVPSSTPPSPLPIHQENGRMMVSPRARNLAAQRGLDLDGLTGTGPEGRIIERDVLGALESKPLTTRAARDLPDSSIPANGTGLGGRITLSDLSTVPTQPTSTNDDAPTLIPLSNIRKITAQRMRQSLQNSAQLTLNASADARALLALRKRFKGSPESLGLREVTLNDLILFAVSRVLPQYPDLNATLNENTLLQYQQVHLGFAVDTPRGLLVPVIRRADTLTLKVLSTEAKRLAELATQGRATAEILNGGTFTVSNLGGFGIETFTPVINPPQVAILGVGNVNLKPVEVDGEVEFIPHMALSLTIDHQVIDGAPGARFLQVLSTAIASIDLLLVV